MFSPYYARSGRRDPENHVCINVALYAPGANRWSMTERGRPALKRSSQEFRVGPSAMSWHSGVLTIRFDEVSPPWPGTNWLPRRMRGEVVFRPSFVTDAVRPLDADGAHGWWAIAPCGGISVTCETDAVHNWDGHGYFDSNWGETGLENSFRRWDWARARTPDSGAMVLYDSVLSCGGTNRLGLCWSGEGRQTAFDPPSAAALKRGVWRVARSIPCDGDTPPATETMLEDSPFYARSVVSSQIGGDRHRFVHESFDGRRFASPAVRALLPFRMPRRRG